MELGKKAVSGYTIGKKILDWGVDMGKKIRNIVATPMAQSILNVLPAPVQSALRVAGELGEGALGKAEALQQKLNSGEALVSRVNSSVQSAMRGIEAPMPRAQSRVGEQGANIRVPERLVTGGNQNQILMGEPKQPPVMTF